MSSSVARGGPKVATWLHISDLHFSPHDHGDFDRETVLDGLCDAVQTHRERDDWAPDLIFVTGDIANRGADKEYEAASGFFDRLLVAAGLSKQRLFVVPGNHDVDRPIGVLLPRTLKTEAEADTFFADPPSPPPTERPRGVRPEDRHLAKLRAFRQWHESYFKDVHPTERFSACAPPTVVSLHDGVRVGVLPINTATFSDDGSDHSQLWVGRSWLHRAVRKLNEASPDLRVALMHHPLDWLHDIERGQIKTELFNSVDVVLRGHLHDTEAEASVAPGRHVVQLAAGATWQSPHWPRRALYVRASLHERHLRVRPIRFERDHRRRWTVDTSLFDDHEGYEGVFPIPSKTAPPATSSRSSTPSAPVAARARVQRQERTWTVYPDGIAEVRVRLSGVECDDGLVLAMPARPFCAIASDDTARVPGAVRVVRDQPGGRTRFRLEGAGQYETCEWSYTISNALALDQFDVERLYPTTHGSSALPRGITGRSHVVRFDNGHLRLVYEFADDVECHAGPIVRSAQPVVEAARDDHGVERWERVQDEENRCAVDVSADGRTVTLDVDRPVRGYRYTLAYTPAARGHALTADAVNHALELLDLCRGSYSGHELVGRLTTEVASALSDCKVGALGSRSSWLGFVWNDRENKRLMLPCFGRHTNQQWSVRFPYGGGVAGHAFRFAKVALWGRGLAPRRSVVFQEQTDAGSNYTYDYRWVVSVPLLLRPRGPAIGIVSFASPDSETDGDHWLEQLVLDATSGDPGRTAAAQRSSDKLLEMVNVRFWSCLTAATEVTFGLRRWAQTVLQNFETPPPPA